MNDARILEVPMADELGPLAVTIPVDRIAGRILLIRGQKVILDSDLAELYGVPTKRLNERIKRNRNRFPRI